MCRCNSRCNSRYMNCNSNNNCRCKNCNINNITTTSCSCKNMYANETSSNNSFPANYLYGYAYTPTSCMNKTFTPECGLENGTIFPELVSPYSPGQSIDFIEYLRNGGI